MLKKNLTLRRDDFILSSKLTTLLLSKQLHLFYFVFYSSDFIKRVSHEAIHRIQPTGMKCLRHQIPKTKTVC